MYAGICAFKSRSPTWLPGPSHVTSDDDYWVVSTKHRERVSAFASPDIGPSGVFLGDGVRVVRRAPAVQLRALSPDLSTDPVEVVVGLAPVEGALDHLADAVDAVEGHRQQARREEGDVLVGRREDERRAVHEEGRE